MELVMQRLAAERRVYLDANATTPPHPRALEAMMETARNSWGNPSSSYNEGVAAKASLTRARSTFARLMAVEPNTIIFTSCGTESNNIAIRSVMSKSLTEGRNVLITSAIEHPSVKRTAACLTGGVNHVQVGVDSRGYVSKQDLENKLRQHHRRVAMVSIIFAQNEVGTIQYISQIAKMVKQYCPQAVFHSDATQILGKDVIQPELFGVDMMTGSAHKFHGPRGVGILYAKKGIIDSYVTPMTGGGQEDGCRSGTENVAAIVGAAVAFEQAIGNEIAWLDKFQRTRANRDAMMDYLLKQVPGARVNGDPQNGLFNTLSISFPHVHGHALAEYLDKHGVSVGSGSACSKGKPSESLQAMYGTSPEATALIHNTIRISLTPHTSRDDCEYAMMQIVQGWQTLAKGSRN